MVDMLPLSIGLVGQSISWLQQSCFSVTGLRLTVLSNIYHFSKLSLISKETIASNQSKIETTETEQKLTKLHFSKEQ